MTLKNGIHVQVYRDSTLYSRAKAEAFCVTAKSLGVVGIAWHGFVSELTRERFEPLAELCAKHDLQASCAFGLGDVGARAASVGRAIAKVSNHPLCTSTLFDMEGAWEDEANDIDEAYAMMDAYRSDALNACAGDQPWSMPIPRHHSSPLWALMAKWLQFRAPQFYWNNLRRSLGDAAYAVMRAKYEAAWKWREENRVKDRLGNSVSPVLRTVTLQGYHWVDWTLVDALCAYATTRPVFMWCEPFPTESTQVGMRAVVALRDRGFTGPRAVEQFQRSPAGVAAGLVIDNKCGSKTRAALGF